MDQIVRQDDIYAFSKFEEDIKKNVYYVSLEGKINSLSISPLNLMETPFKLINYTKDLEKHEKDSEEINFTKRNSPESKTFITYSINIYKKLTGGEDILCYIYASKDKKQFCEENFPEENFSESKNKAYLKSQASKFRKDYLQKIYGNDYGSIAEIMRLINGLINRRAKDAKDGWKMSKSIKEKSSE